MLVQLAILSAIAFVSYWVYKNYNSIKTQHLIIGGSVAALSVYFFYDQIMEMTGLGDTAVDVLGAGYEDYGDYDAYGGGLMDELELDDY